MQNVWFLVISVFRLLVQKTFSDYCLLDNKLAVIIIYLINNGLVKLLRTKIHKYEGNKNGHKHIESVRIYETEDR